ncbi:hypothetical protein JD844_013472 [Phrynosoma platyrhinos]|uniref:Neural proliferation differentiation and control protein 1 n=1 Tax=Phrynosoma platyrhinos TaxID=52577 RepID=A0ABQ7TMQ4_PHRPL|nr:hypothetical protein JD844_013472 [Phrynosoma platyrhinos]
MLGKANRWLAIFAALLATGASWEADPLCPARYKLNCLLRRRLGCGPDGAPSCGPCFPNYEEDSGGDCVPKKVPKHESKTKTQKRPKDLPGLIRSLLAKHEKELQPSGMETTLPGSTEEFEPSNSPTPFPTSLPTDVSYSASTIPVSSESYESITVQTTTPPRSVKVDFKQRSRPPVTNLNKAVTLSNREPPKPVQQVSTESETENGDYTVYECPGLAPSGEMEIHNPLFDTTTLHRCPP